jgi:hypothetical protein
VSKVLTSLSEWWCERGGENLGNLIVYADNAHRHNAAVAQQFMARNAIVIEAHLSYSPDLAPFESYLIDHVKGLFRRESFASGEQLLSAVEDILEFLEKWR